MTDQFPAFNHAEAVSNFFLSIPDDFNFAFDVVGKRATEADKTALIAIDRTGERATYHSYSDLDKA